MFDDQPTGQQPAGVPTNLPVGEPEDMFSGVDEAPPAAPPAAPAEPAPPAAPTALGAGVLTPKNEPAAPVESATPAAPQPGAGAPPAGMPPMPSAGGDAPPMRAMPGQAGHVIKEPTMSRGLILSVGVIVVIIILGGGGWLLYTRFASSGNTNTTSVPSPFDAPAAPVADAPSDSARAVTDIEPSDDVTLSTDAVDDALLFGQPTDTDADGLDDTTEQAAGTDPSHWDTDGDGLSDGDEIVIWETDPLDPDTDGDTYEDGEEVKAGYNPAGDGKLFEPPKEETTSL